MKERERGHRPNAERRHVLMICDKAGLSHLFFQLGAPIVSGWMFSFEVRGLKSLIIDGYCETLCLGIVLAHSYTA